MYPFPLADEILRQPLTIENGDLIVPSGRGLGIDIDESVIQKYPFIPGPWSFFRINSPPETVAVTGDHSVFVEERGRPVARFARDLRPGDPVTLDHVRKGGPITGVLERGEKVR